MTLVVILTVRTEALDQFHAFETSAAAVMAKYGGAIERTVAVPPAHAGDFTREVHIVTFPGEEAFAAYREDPALAEMAQLRSEAVVRTEVLIGEDGPRYGAARDVDG